MNTKKRKSHIFHTEIYVGILGEIYDFPRFSQIYIAGRKAKTNTDMNSNYSPNLRFEAPFSTGIQSVKYVRFVKESEARYVMLSSKNNLHFELYLFWKSL